MDREDPAEDSSVTFLRLELIDALLQPSMHMQNENLYFIAIIPPQQICEEITAFKLDFADRFESKVALKVIPHITLKAPFKVNSAARLELKEWFRKLPVSFGAFQIKLKNFDVFRNRNHPVVFVHPVINSQLMCLQKAVLDKFRLSYPDVGIMETELKFTPHITIAYRDLSFDKFQEAWHTYKVKEYQAEFEVNSFHLMQHDGKTWHIVETYSFS